MQLEVVCHGFISMEALIEQPVDLRQVVGPRNLVTKIHLATVTLCCLGHRDSGLVPQIGYSVKLYNHGSWLATSAFTFKTLLRHYAKQVLTPW